MRSYKSDMTAELKRTAGSFVTVAQSEDGASTEYNHEASMEYVRRNELPLIIIDSQSKLIDNEIFNAYSILKVKNLRNEELYFIADFLSEYVDNPIDSISKTDILRIRGMRIGKSNYYQLTELRVGSKSYQDASLKDVRGMAEYITQFVYMDEFISPDISGEVILKKQLLFENLRPILISSSSPYTLLHNLEDSEIEDLLRHQFVQLLLVLYHSADVLIGAEVIFPWRGITHHKKAFAQGVLVIYTARGRADVQFHLVSSNVPFLLVQFCMYCSKV